MEKLDEEVNRAIETFLAAIMSAAERAAIAALRAAMADRAEAAAPSEPDVSRAEAA